mgnify:CR=1 FL=1
MTTMTQKLIYLALAGAAGTVARFILAEMVVRLDGIPARWGTIVVNLTGCFLAGLAWTLFEQRWPGSAEMRLLVMVGFMGAFTTFSAIILETSELVRAAQWMYAAGHVIAQNGLGFAGLYVGVMIGRHI